MVAIPLPTDPIAHFEREFCQGSAIAPELYAVAVAIRDELETSAGHDAEWPIHDALGWEPPSTQYQTRKPHRFIAGAFLLQETGEAWQIKPLNPRLARKNKSDWNRHGRATKPLTLDANGKSTAELKPVKYETPKGAGSRAYRPPINRETFRAICRRHGLDFDTARAKRDEIGSFWEWVAAHPELPIIITEGAKKALCLLSNGYIAIALTGCWGGIRANENGERLAKPKLIADLKPFTVDGRTITIALDRDLKRETKRTVWKATRKTAWLLEQAGCTVVIARWDNAGGRDKGVDDLIVNQGLEAWEQALATARSVKVIEILHRLQNPLGNHQPTLRVNVPDLAKAISPESIPNSGIVALLSGMGTAKTKLIALLIAMWEKAIAPGHREALQRGLGARLGLDYLHDTDRFRGQKLGADGKPTKRLSLCWDSILAIDPRDYPPGSYVLVLDEVDQGLRHLILGGTCAKDGKRPALIARATELIKNAGLVILASADLTAIELDFVAAIRGETPWILQNDYRSNGWFSHFATSQKGLKGSTRVARGAILTQLMVDLRQGDRVCLATDTLRNSRAIEQFAIGLGIPSDQILRYDSETSGDPLQREFADRPDEFLSRARLRLLIYSPSLTSGVSIERNPFDSVYGLFEGQSIAPWDCLQQLGRVRQSVRRLIFAPHWGKGHRLTDKRNQLQAMGDLYRRSQLVAKGVDDPSVLEAIDQTSQDAIYAAKAIADQNNEMADFGLQIQLRLEAAGHKVQKLPIERLVADLEQDRHTIAKAAKAERAAIAKSVASAELMEALQRWDDALDRVKALHCEAITHEAIITADEAQQIREQRVVSYADRLKLERFEICDFLAIAPEDLEIEQVEADRNGAYRRELSRLEGLIWDGLTVRRDREKISRLTRWELPLPTQDLPGANLFTMGADVLGVMDMIQWAIDTPGWHNDTPQVVEFANRLKAHAPDVRLTLGFTVWEGMTACQVLGMVLKAVGLRTVSTRQGTGDRIRLYSIDDDSLSRAIVILTARAEKHSSKALQPRPHPLADLFLGGVAVTLQDLMDQVDREIDRQFDHQNEPTESESPTTEGQSPHLVAA